MKEFDQDHFRMRISDDLIKEICVKENKTLNAEDMKLTKDLSLQYKPNSRFYVLLEGEDNSNLTSEARQLAASSEYSRYTAALALCSTKLTHRVMGNLFLKVSQPKVPTRFFENRQDALTWLRQKIQSEKTRP
ncbi:MAG TPA: STAS/SEC14 domain-containing protein [Bacteroidia bacterium]|nr:STAS/SEC14 domain-containing protein [Bacteroidia bacterium]